MGEILGRVVSPPGDEPRGPDVVYRITVPPSWLTAGQGALEVELPRNLACANCEGGGCDACARSGAFTLRGKDEPPEIVVVSLPERADPDAVLVLRLPEHGALAPHGSALPRGLLLLRVKAGESPSAGVRRVTEHVVPTSMLTLDQQRWLVRRSALLAVGLTGLFVLLLWLAGWL